MLLLCTIVSALEYRMFNSELSQLGTMTAELLSQDSMHCTLRLLYTMLGWWLDRKQFMQLNISIQILSPPPQGDNQEIDVN